MNSFLSMEKEEYREQVYSNYLSNVPQTSSSGKSCSVSMLHSVLDLSAKTTKESTNCGICCNSRVCLPVIGLKPPMNFSQTTEHLSDANYFWSLMTSVEYEPMTGKVTDSLFLCAVPQAIQFLVIFLSSLFSLDATHQKAECC